MDLYPSKNPGNFLPGPEILQRGAVTGSFVPEPETYVMLLAGLGLLGHITLRHNAA